MNRYLKVTASAAVVIVAVVVSLNLLSERSGPTSAVETGLATELPWAADSPASWQHVAPGDSR